MIRRSLWFPLLALAASAVIAGAPAARPKGSAPDAGPDIWSGMVQGRDGGAKICTVGFVLRDGECVCAPFCRGVECGDDGCGGSCGICVKGSHCGADMHCYPCKPKCPQGRGCADDGCGRACMVCPFELTCDQRSGACVVPGTAPERGAPAPSKH